MVDRAAAQGRADRNVFVLGRDISGRTRPEVRAEMSRIAADLRTRPIVLVAGDRRVEVSPADVGADVDIDAATDTVMGAGAGWNPIEWPLSFLNSTSIDRLPVDVDVTTARRTLEGLEPTFEHDAQNARHDFNPEDVTLIPAVEGVSVDIDETLSRIATAAASPDDRVVTWSARTKEPEVTTEELEQLGWDDMLGTFTTNFVAGQARVTNIRTIAKMVDDTAIEPGQTYSINEDIGPRTEDKGFVSAGVIYDGRFSEDVGGGVSQFATTLFNAAFFAGLDVPEHKAHSFYISRYPEGREATLNYPDIDLKITNNYHHKILIKTWITDTSVSVALFGQTDGRTIAENTGPRRNEKAPATERRLDPGMAPGSEKIESKGSAGFDITVTRTTTWPDGHETTDEYRTKYLPEPKVIVYNS